MTARNDGPPVLGIDLGGTKILVGVVSGSHRILGRAKRTTPAKDGGNAIVAAIMGCVEDAIESAELPRGDIVAAGIGSPGPLDPKTGTILFSANLNVRDFPLGAQLSAAIGRPVLVRNDVRVAGIGEFRLGIGRGYRDVIAAFVGTGIGGCIIRGGQIIEGLTGNAGEIGHMIIKAGGPRCGCGNRGCMEALASKTAIARRVEKAIRSGFPTALADKIARKNGRLKSRDLFDAVSANDVVALREVQRAAHYLGVGIGSLINALGPEIVIIGGGVAGALGEPYLELVRSAARAQAFTDPEGKVRIERGALGDDAGILGAALLAREHFANR